MEKITIFEIFYIILLSGMVYKGTRSGISAQIISLIGWVVLVFCSLGYYEYLSKAIFGFMLQDWAKPLSFFALAMVPFIIIKIIEKMIIAAAGEELSLLERIGGAFVSAIRALVIFGMIGIQILLMPMEQAKTFLLEKTPTALFFVNIDVDIYSWLTGLTGIKKNIDSEDVMMTLLGEKDK
ncbi:MAG: CvpA family protein [Candidatus Omnitrophica bacterium]|nr:CvpA family protein [Candidatus Omnitrophota bacterium]